MQSSKNQEEKKISPKELRAILAEYAYNPDVMNDEEDKVNSVKKALSQIPEADRIIFCLYLDLGASRKVGELLGVSHSTILKEINRIKNKIRYQIIENGDDIY